MLQLLFAAVHVSTRTASLIRVFFAFSLFIRIPKQDEMPRKKEIKRPTNKNCHELQKKKIPGLLGSPQTG